MGLLGHGVLVGEDGAGLVGIAGADGVHGRDYREEVLEFMEVVWGLLNGAVEGVKERGVKGSERELRDDVGEVEGCPHSQD